MQGIGGTDDANRKPAAKLSDGLASAGDGRHSWAAFPDLGWSVGIAADRADSLASLVWELAATRTAEPPSDLTLEKWAHAIVGRAGGLAETLSVG